MQTAVFASVWDALEEIPSTAANMRARAQVMIGLREHITGWQATQAEAARRLGITQPRLSDLLRGRIDRFSLDALINLATRAGLRVRVEIDVAA